MAPDTQEMNQQQQQQQQQQDQPLIEEQPLLQNQQQQQEEHDDLPVDMIVDQEFQEANQVLVADVQEVIPRVAVTEVAVGTPIQITTKKLGWWARRKERNRIAAEAKKVEKDKAERLKVMTACTNKEAGAKLPKSFSKLTMDEKAKVVSERAYKINNNSPIAEDLSKLTNDELIYLMDKAYPSNDTYKNIKDTLPLVKIPTETIDEQKVEEILNVMEGHELDPVMRTYLQRAANLQSGDAKNSMLRIEDQLNLRVWQTTMHKQEVQEGPPPVTPEQTASQNKANMQMAKMLYLMHIGQANFKGVENYLGGQAMVAGKSAIPMTKFLSHGGRTQILTPKKGIKGSDSNDDFDKSLFGKTGKQSDRKATSRAFATHFVTQEKQKERSGKIPAFRALFSPGTKHFGIDMAIGGLGNVGINGAAVAQDGTTGHMYVGRRTATYDNGGSLSIGMETSRPGTISSVGLIHDWHAYSAYNSSTMGRKDDRFGAKVSGRQFNLQGVKTMYNPNKDMTHEDMVEEVNTFEQYMNRLSEENPQEYNQIMDALLNSQSASAAFIANLRGIIAAQG
jgi:hypothetical protein